MVVEGERGRRGGGGEGGVGGGGEGGGGGGGGHLPLTLPVRCLRPGSAVRVTVEAGV